MCPAKPTRTRAAASLKDYNAKRDFRRTKEPPGSAPLSKAGKSLAFVIQKHAASHLHFDLRLELDGVMKSWAVPKGPSIDTLVKRLAMEVEDHPIAYNKFEGTIPKGQYGGGTVMLWDRGTYTPDEPTTGEDNQAAVRRSLKAGKLAFTFHGTRLHGSFALVRTRRGEGKPQWLLFKHHDEYATSGRDIVDEVTTSVESGRTMQQIAAGENGALAGLEGVGAIEPMEANNGKLPLPAGEYAVEALAHGTRALAFIANGTAQLVAAVGKRGAAPADLLENAPDVQNALLYLARHHEGALVLDGVLATDGSTLVVIDVLLNGAQLVVKEPWIERRNQLEAAIINSAPKTRATTQALRINEWIASDAAGIPEAARALDAASVVAKRIDSEYESGRSKAWIRVKT